MFDVWKKHVLINYYTLTTILTSASWLAYWFDYLQPGPLTIILGLCLGLACFAISSRMIIIFITACVSFISLGIYYQMINYALLPTIFATLATMLMGYSLTFSKGRWFIILYLISLGIVAGIAKFFGFFLPTH